MDTSILKGIQLALFATFAAAPIGWMLAFGAAKPYEQRAQASMPDLMSAVAPEGEAREQLSDAIFERSDLRRMAISTKNAMFFGALGFADAEEVVSGAPGWLFYKPEIEGWTCERLAENRKDIEAVVLLGEIAAANGLPFVLAIAPNKASIERDAVQGRAQLLLDCYFETADLLEARLAEIRLPSILHHTPLVRARGESGDTYFRTDTHWLPVTGFLAAGDLMRSLGRPGFPDGFQPSTTQQPRSTDLRRMLLLSPNETIPVPDLTSEPARSQIAANRIDGEKILIVHDSFYAEIEESLRGLISDIDLQHIEKDREQIPDAIQRAARIVVSSAERSVLPRVRSDEELGWLSPVGRWVLDGADITADQCLWEQVVDLKTTGLTVPQIPASDTGELATKAAPPSPQFEVIAPGFTGTASCLRIEAEFDMPDLAYIFFQTRDAEQSYIEQRAMRRELGAGVQTIQLVLPASAIGKTIGIGSGAGPGNLRIVSIKAAPAPAQFAPIVVRPKPVVTTAAVLRPQQVVLAGPGQLDAFMVATHRGDSGRIRPDGAAFEARSTDTDRPPVGDGDGVLVRIDGATARLFSGRMVRVEVTARASPDRGSVRLRTMYSRSGAPSSSGWQELSLTPEFTTQSFEYKVPLSPPASVDTIAFWGDPTGKNLGVDIAAVVVRTIDDTVPAQ